MAIKEVPVDIKVYYKSMLDAFTQKRDKAIETLNKITLQAKALHDEALSNREIYKSQFKVDLLKYSEFVDNQYKTGIFIKLAKGLFINRSNNYVLVSDLFNLYNLAKLQKQIYDINIDITKYDKLLNLSYRDYCKIMKVYMTEVHKKLILEGAGYSFGQRIGWICINRCIIKNPKPKLDFAATKKRKAQLLAEGKRLYNQEEADWCKRNGIEYNAEDYRVYMNKEYCYEIPLLHCSLHNAGKLQFVITDSRPKECRGKTNEELAEMCNNDTTKICELGVDLKTKLNICDSVDKILYAKFIRNENQEPSTTPKINRKNRQRL